MSSLLTRRTLLGLSLSAMLACSSVHSAGEDSRSDAALPRPREQEPAKLPAAPDAGKAASKPREHDAGPARTRAPLEEPTGAVVAVEPRLADKDAFDLLAARAGPTWSPRSSRHRRSRSQATFGCSARSARCSRAWPSKSCAASRSPASSWR